MSNYKVVTDNGQSDKTFNVEADSRTQASFLAGVHYAADLIFLAQRTGILDALINLSGPEAGIASLLDVARDEIITVEATGL